jgi:DNA-binding MarR family transcriptional regulator
MHTQLSLMNEDTGPRACHCSAARRLARHVTRLYERHLAPVGITSTQFSILALLRESPGMTAGALAEATGMDRTTMLRAMKPLERDGLAAARTDDTRRRGFTLTAAGALKLSEAGPLWAAAQQDYELEIGREHARRLRRDLLDITRPG